MAAPPLSPLPVSSFHIKAATFDLDDTIWDAKLTLTRTRAAFHAHLVEVAPRMAEAYPLEKFFPLMDQIAVEIPEKAHDYTFRRAEAVRRACIETGYEHPEKIVESAMHVWQTNRNDVAHAIFPSVLPMLKRLKEKGLRIACITNGNADPKRIPELRDLVEFSVHAEEVGFPKPHRAPFERAIQRLGLPASDIVHIGDDYHSDITGARAAGFKTVWFRRPNHAAVAPEQAIDQLHADVIIEDMAQLEDILYKWMENAAAAPNQ